MKTPQTHPSSTITPTARDAVSPTGMDRRRFVKGLGIAGASLVSAGAWLGGASSTQASGHRALSESDAAILRFLAVAEILETDLWQQYTELALGNQPFADALSNLDDDMVQYVVDNTADELSHATFLNAFLQAHGAEPVDFDRFRTLPSSTATGATQTGRLTNLTGLTVDTSWYTRYQGTGNPDFGDTFPQAVNIDNRTAIPLRDDYSAVQIQAIANVAAFHFASIEQGGSSLYTRMTESASNLTVLRIVVSIGGTEVDHYGIWRDTASDAPPLDTGDGLVFPDLSTIPDTQPNHIFPRACEFIAADLPFCSVIRPSSLENAGAVAAVTALTNSGLFTGQSPAFFHAMHRLARNADAATRTL